MLRKCASGPEIGLPARISSAFCWGRPDLGPAAGPRPAGGPLLKLSLKDSDRNLARQPDVRPTIAYSEFVFFLFFSHRTTHLCHGGHETL